MSTADDEKALDALMRRQVGWKPHEILRVFRGKSEEERRALAPYAARRHKEATARERGPNGEGLEREFAPHATCIATAATATLSELMKLRRWEPSYHVCRAIIDRRPPWLAEAATLLMERCDSLWRIADIAHCVHELVLQGLIPPPAHARYPIGLAFAYGGYREWLNDEKWYDRSRHDASSPILDRIRDGLDGLRPEIWRQFEVEGDNEVSLINCQTRRESVEGGWAGALATLSDEGLLERARLLDASLEALARGFAPHRARWHYQFHELMAPTLEERAIRAELYFDLLASPAGPIASFAMAALLKVGKARKLDPARVILRVEPALYCATVSVAKGALKLMAGALQERPDLSARALPLLAIGLEHASEEVQDGALAQMEAGAGAFDEPARRAIEDRLQIMSPALRSRAQALLGARQTANEEVRGVEACIATLRQRAMALPADLRSLAGVDAALQAIDAGAFDVPRARFTGMDIPRLNPEKAIVPIESFEEFVDEALIVIERPMEIERVERALAAALRFSAHRPPDAAGLLAPLQLALRRFAPKRWDRSDWATPRGVLQITLEAFFDEFELAQAVIPKNDPGFVLLLRAQDMARAIRSTKTASQLSEPTHSGFWIDPLVAVRRSCAAEATPILGLADQVLTLLRLAPEGRAEALRQAARLTGEWGAALRHALGGEETFGATRALWVAARRARAPFDDDDRVAELMSDWLAGPLRHGVHAQMRDLADWPASGDFCFPTEALLCTTWLWPLGGCSDAFRLGEWIRALWPQNPRPVFTLARNAKCMQDEAGLCSIAEGLTLLLDSDVPIDAAALLMLCNGLDAQDKATARATVDALIAVIDDGRLDGETLGAAIHDYLSRGRTIAKRWPQRLRDIASSSLLAAFVVRRALERAFWPLESRAAIKDIHCWIDLLRELCAETGTSISDSDSRLGIEHHGRSGKSLKSARALLAQEGDSSKRLFAPAVAYALDKRLRRAEGWNGRFALE